MLTAALLAVLAAGAALVPADAQNSLYSNGGCRITDFGPEVNVSCSCDQTLRQTSVSQPINHLDITGCLADDSPSQREARLSFLQPSFLRPSSSADAFDFVLLRVRSVNISQIRLRLEPVRNHREAAGHPLEQLHANLVELKAGLPDGALQGLSNLERVSLDVVYGPNGGVRAARSSLADLPRLRELTITGSHFQFVSAGMLARTPRLHRLRFSSSRFDFVASEAIVVENDSDDDADGSEACSPDDDSWLEFDVMGFNTMNANAVRVSAVRSLLVSKTTVGTMYSGALNVTLRAPADCRPLLRFTENTFTDLRAEAVVVENEAATPALLELGASTLHNTALSPRELRLLGAFERRPVAGLPADQFDCSSSCCQCPGTVRLIEVALQTQPSQQDTDVFVTALGSARCVDDTTKTFLEFASDCMPDANLTARVGQLVPLPTLPPTSPPTTPSAASPGLLAPLLLLLPPLALVAAVRG